MRDLANGQSTLNPEFREDTMSKLMIIFVLFVSGALYDPPRVLNQLGPEAAAIGLKIKNSLPYH